jgi:3-hydroxyacyl-CoA dehydrogenase/enoyl-CoA hydratase/3-hydroxybutyryl-CoA epimerase
MSIEESVRLNVQEDIAFIEWDLVGESANKLNSATMFRFKEVLEQTAKSDAKAVIIISRKKSIFMAGADIEEIKSLKTKEDFANAVSQGQGIMNMIEDMNKPVIAAIHGACVGGGCELSLACDYRIATDHKSTVIGLPETKLGILPGFGGCVRLPRVVGIQASLDIILAGKTPPAKKALKIGLIDKLVYPDSLEEQAVKFAKEIIAKGAKKRRKYFQPKNMMDRFIESFAGKGVAFGKAKEATMKASHGHYPAPLAALDVVKKTYGMSDRTRALQIECDHFCEMAVTDVSHHLIQLFFMMEDVKKQTGVSNPDIDFDKVQRLGVLGAGTMGGGIVYVAADKGVEVRLKDINKEALAVGFNHAVALWQKKIKRRRMNQYDLKQKMAKVSGGLDYAGFKRLDLVVEAVVENMDIKKSVIAETAKNCSDDCVIVTNTSSLSVTEMASAHPNPSKFAGMHFFNPVDKMPLVEVIRGPETSDETVAAVFELSKRMGKFPVVVKDGPGFLVNRLLLPYMAEAAFLFHEGMAVDVVDEFYVKEFGMPMGPFALMDEVGLDVCIKVLKIFRQAFGERVEIAPVMEALEKSGRLGKKGKKGFYLYDEKGKRTGVDPEIYSVLGVKAPTNPHDSKVCLERGVFAMINEAALAIVEDKIVEKPQDVDLAMIMGTGFPPFRGGLLKYADTLGSEYIANQLDIYAGDFGKRLSPSEPLRSMAKTNRTFH